MKIGIVTTWFERGAAYVSKQYESLLESENDVFIYARGGEVYAKGDKKWDKVNVSWAKKYPMPVSSTYVDEQDFISWITVNSIETVLFNEQDWWQPLIQCKKLGIKTGGYIDYYTDSTVELFDVYDFLICNTLRHYSVFSHHPQCYYIPWGTDVSMFQPSEKEENVLTFFHSAGMNPHRKGTDLSIQAFDILVKKHRNIKFIIHTQANLIHFFPNLKKTINDLISNGYLEIIEETVGAPGLYHLGDVYVYPSRLEGIGLTIVEALSCGLPVVTSDQAPMNEFVTQYSQVAKIQKLTERSDSYYWQEAEVDIDDLRNKMEYFVINVKEISKIKNKTRLEALAKYDWRNNKQQINEIFIKSQILPLTKKTHQLIDMNDNHRFPFITKFPLIYKRLYQIYSVFK